MMMENCLEMKIIEKSGKTIDEAVNEALNELNVSKEEVEIEVVSEGKRGILLFSFLHLY